MTAECVCESSGSQTSPVPGNARSRRLCGQSRTVRISRFVFRSPRRLPAATRQSCSLTSPIAVCAAYGLSLGVWHFRCFGVCRIRNPHGDQPFMELEARKGIDSEVRELGARIVVLAPQLERYTRALHKKLNLPFDISHGEQKHLTVPGERQARIQAALSRSSLERKGTHQARPDFSVTVSVLRIDRSSRCSSSLDRFTGT